MADGLNSVQIIGNLGADVELRYSANGTAIASFRVAVGRTFQDGNGNRKSESEWFRCIAWNKLAELCAQHLSKGSKVYLEGRQQTRSWDGPDGQKRYMTELVANQVLFLDRAPANSSSHEEVDPDDVPFDMT